MALSIIAIVIAAGALVVSAISLRWQIQTRAQQRATQVRVRIEEHSFDSFHGIEIIGGPRGPPPLLTYTVNVVVHNDGERGEWLRSISLWGPTRREAQQLDV